MGYTLSDLIPYSLETLSAIYQSYLNGLGSLPYILLPYIGLTSVLLLYRSVNTAAALTAPLWIFLAVEFFLKSFSQIHWAAHYYAALFALESVFLLVLAVWTRPPPAKTKNYSIGAVLFGAALLIPVSPLYGLPVTTPLLLPWTPLSLAVGTTGVILCAKDPLPLVILTAFIPLLFVIIEVVTVYALWAL